MAQRTKSYFFSSVLGSLGRLFNSGNVPDKKAFIDLLDSCVIKTEPTDSASTVLPGHIMKALEADILSRVDANAGGYVKGVCPSQLPEVLVSDIGCYDDAGIAQGAEGYNPTIITGNGMYILLVKKGIAGNRHRAYVVRMLVDDNTFDYDGSNNLIIKDNAITNTNIEGDIEIEKIEVLDKGSVITGNGTTTNYKAILDEDGQIFIFNDSEGGLFKALLNGDVTMTKTGLVTIADKAITLAKMNDLAEGVIIVGQKGGGTPTALNAATEACILVGQGNELKSVAISGALTMTKTGAFTLTDGTVKTRNLHPDLPGVGLGYSGSDDTKKLDVVLGAGLTIDPDGKIMTTYETPLTYTFTGETTSAVKTELFLGSMSERLTIDEETLYYYEVLCIGVQTAGTAGTVGDSYTRKSIGTIVNRNDTVTLIGVPVELLENADIDFAGVMEEEADDTNDSLKVSVTGEVDKTISWMIRVQITKHLL